MPNPFALRAPGILNMSQPTMPQPYAGMTPQAQGGFGNRLVQFFQQNPGAISALAAGIGSQPTFGQGFASAASMMPQAQAQDRQLREQMERRRAITEALKARENGTDLPPWARGFLETHPELAAQYLLRDVTTEKPTPMPKPNIETFWDEQGRQYKAEQTPTGWQRIGGFEQPTATPAAPSPLGKLLEERNTIFAQNPDDPTLTIYDQRIAREAAGQGISLEVDPMTGRVSFKQGDIEAEDVTARKQAAEEMQADKVATMLDATAGIKDAFQSANTPVTGTLSMPFALYSGSPAGRVRSYVRTLQSGVGLQAIVRLKEASKTGATGFGQMNKAELDLLLNDIGALDPATTEPDIFLDTVERIESRFQRIRDDIKKNVSPERFKELGLDVLFSDAELTAPIRGSPGQGGVVPWQTYFGNQ